MNRSALAEKHPWTQPWWKADGDSRLTLAYLLLIHVLAVVGILLFPVPGWKIFLATLAATAAVAAQSAGPTSRRGSLR